MLIDVTLSNSYQLQLEPPPIVNMCAFTLAQYRTSTILRHMCIESALLQYIFILQFQATIIIQLYLIFYLLFLCVITTLCDELYLTNTIHGERYCYEVTLSFVPL